MPRVKPQPSVMVANLEDADKVLARLGELARDLGGINDRMNSNIATAKRQAQDAAKPLLAEREGLESALAGFAAARKADLFAKAKSQTLLHGVLGFRKFTALKTLKGVTWKKVLERIKGMPAKLLERKQPLCVRLKVEVDKEALRKLPGDLLQEAGVELSTGDEFFYEIKTEDAGKRAA